MYSHTGDYKMKRITLALLALILSLLLMAAFPAGDVQPAPPAQLVIPVTGPAESAYPPPPVGYAYPPPVDLKDPGQAATDNEDSLVDPDDGGDSDEREILPKIQ